MFYKWNNEWIMKSEGKGVIDMAEPFLKEHGAKFIRDSHTYLENKFGPSIEFETDEDVVAFILKWTC